MVTNNWTAPGITACLRLLSERPPFTFQKAAFCSVKGHLLQHERRHIGNTLIINGLRSATMIRPQTPGFQRHKGMTIETYIKLKQRNSHFTPPEKLTKINTI